MRKFIYILFAAAAVVFISCDKNNQGTTGTDPVVSPDVEYINVTFGVSREDVGASEEETKAYFLENWKEQYWRKTDRVSVWSNAALGENCQFENKAGDGRNAEFTGEVASGTKFHILYPYNSSATITDGKILTSLPAVQTVTADYSCDDDALLSAGIVEDVDNNVRLNNYFSIIRIQIPNGVEDITSVMIEGNNGEVLAGDVEISLDGQTIVSKEDGEKATAITLKPSGETFAPGYYGIAVIPTAFEKGFKLVIKHSGSKKCSIKNVKTANTAARNAGLAFPALSLQDSDYKYYYILTKGDLKEWQGDSENWTSKDVVYLGADIDYGGDQFSRNSSTKAFTGTFNGRNHSIYNIRLFGQNTRAGLFYELTGTAKNLCIGSADYNWETGEGTYDGISESYIDGALASSTKWYYAGGIAAYVQEGGQIDNCVNFANVYADYATSTYDQQLRIGGIAGTMKGNTSITNCKNFGDVTMAVEQYRTGEERYVEAGGITSRFDGNGCTLKGCSNYGTVVNTSKGLRHLGGIIAAISTSDATFSDNHNFGVIRNEAEIDSEDSGIYLCIGGVIGYIEKASALNCTNEESAQIINTADTEIYIHIGGIVGDARDCGSIESCVNKGKIRNEGKVGNDDTIAVGGICGRTYSSKEERSDSSPKIIKCSTTSTSAVINTGCATDNAGMVIGGIVGWADNANIIGGSSANKCVNRGTVTESSASSRPGVGGVIGYANKAGNLLSYCENYGTITFSGERDKSVDIYPAIGGVTGWIVETCTVDYQSNYGKIILEDFAATTFTVGGVLGTYNNTTSQTFTYLYNEGEITATNVSAKKGTNGSAVGGICSGSYQNADKGGKTYKNCTNKGNINMGINRSGYTTVDNHIERLRIGGIAGYANKNASGSLVCECNISYYNSSSEQARATIGGIFGYCNIASYSNCTYSGTIWTQNTKYAAYAGGIVGCIRHKSPTIQNCNVSGRVTGSGSGSYMAGLFVSNDTYPYSVTFSNCKIKKGTIATSTTINSLSDVTVALLTGASHSTGTTDGVTVVDSF